MKIQMYVVVKRREGYIDEAPESLFILDYFEALERAEELRTSGEYHKSWKFDVKTVTFTLDKE